VCRVTWDDAVKGGLAGNQHVLEIQAHFLQSADEDEIEPAPTIDEDLGEPDLRHHRIQDQGKLTGLRKAHPLVIAKKQDGDLRPTEWSWYRQLDGQNLPEKQLLVPPVWQNQPELHRLKYASPLQRAPTCFKRYNPLAFRVTSRLTTDTQDQIRLPHTKVSPEIHSPSHFTSQGITLQGFPKRGTKFQIQEKITYY
jgi:hypothetical protein